MTRGLTLGQLGTLAPVFSNGVLKFGSLRTLLRPRYGPHVRLGVSSIRDCTSAEIGISYCTLLGLLSTFTLLLGTQLCGERPSIGNILERQSVRC
jgi:hypothetical protein